MNLKDFAKWLYTIKFTVKDQIELIKDHFNRINKEQFNGSIENSFKSIINRSTTKKISETKYQRKFKKS